MLARTQRFWPSDSNDALERWAIQRGSSYFFPPESTVESIREVFYRRIGTVICDNTAPDST